MSVLVETSIGDLVIDLYTEEAPLTSKNFLKLCKTKYYNFTRIHRIECNFIAQTGDPTGTGQGGQSIYGELGGSRYFPAEHPKLKHARRGTVSMAVSQQTVRGQDGVSGSQFFITLGDDIEYLDGRHTVFGQVVEGLELLDEINSAMCDSDGRPLKDILLRHTIILDDPFADPPGLKAPDRSPLLPPQDLLDGLRIEAGDVFEAAVTDEAELRKREARAQALTLEMIGDLPYADIKPAENVLFVCKLNPATEDDDLRTIFARFGDISSCEVVRDQETERSLGYAFIEFGTKEACEEAYFKMDNVLVDDRRIHVDFSQSVGKYKGRWVRSKGAGDGSRGMVRNTGKYRNAADGDSRHRGRDSYDMVFDRDDMQRRHAGGDRGSRDEKRSSRWGERRHRRTQSRSRSRSRSPRRHRRR
ncbi:Peptidyl-prolyl cis-trans isomerase-like 4 [Coemansia erecta]|uniref:Peptidyl-prolyl cis-trans isomerase n=1 Tax=Coemansia erecta TaxID=147472 RepID=A0A9W8CTK9_9FUNG|nr:Peptidyl-prolyl cis-trans isomerase-like 4 [Coemansia erecta]